MKQNALLILISSSLLLINGCANKSQDVFFNENAIMINFEDIARLTPCASNLVTRGISHSGNYSCIIDSTIEYGLTYHTKLAEISSKPIKKIKVSVWAMRSNINANNFIVCEISKDGQVLNYIKEEIAFYAKKPNDWVNIKFEIDGAKANVFDPGNIFKIYGWRGATKEASYYDDLKIELEF